MVYKVERLAPAPGKAPGTKAQTETPKMKKPVRYEKGSKKTRS